MTKPAKENKNKDEPKVKKDKEQTQALDVARMDGEGAAQGASFQKKNTKSLK